MPNNVTDSKDWDYIIEPEDNLFDLKLKELWNARYLILMFVRNSFVVSYKQTILGPLWFLIRPTLATLMYMFVFGKLARLPTDEIPHSIFYMSGIVCWSYFSDCFMSTSNALGAYKWFFEKVYFPRLAIPISVIIGNVIRLGLQFGLLVIILA